MNLAIRRLAVAAVLCCCAGSALGQQSIIDADRYALEYARRNPQAQNNGSMRQRGIIASSVPAGTIVNVTIPKAQTGTNYNEPIVIQEPWDLNAGGIRPLMVVWNGYGNSPSSFYTPGVSGLDEEANCRSWLTVAMFAVDDQAMGCVSPIPAQTNVEAVIDYMIAHYSVDLDRIYMVGWSMGAGASASYAARHLDPNEPMIAALALDAGTFDLINAYNSESGAFKNIAHLIFGGPPSNPSFTFNYARSESQWYDFGTNAILEASSQLRNLRHVPIHHVYSTDDTVLYLPTQNSLFTNFLTAKGATIASTAVSGQVPPHSWNIMDPVAALDFLQTKTVNRSPASFEITADRSARYYWADVTQRTANQFSTLAVTTNAVANTLTLTGVANVGALTLAPPVASMNVGAHFTVALTTTDVGATSLVIEGVQTQPTYVLNGTSLLTGWTWVAGDLTLPVTATGTTSLEVRFDDFDGVMSGPSTLAINNNLHLTLTGTTPNQPYFFMLGTSEGVLPLSLIDPSDDRNILVGFNPFPIMLPAAFGGAPTASFDLFIPNNAALVGSRLYCQFVTYPGSSHVIDVISNRLDVALTAGP
ncbi:MAG: hypothetical protein IT459_09030 [Planctomycetes bacterium]|nr:hypothetical protein [Planctomycetota bacterium]